jgi:hypothetical protein
MVSHLALWIEQPVVNHLGLQHCLTIFSLLSYSTSSLKHLHHSHFLQFKLKACLNGYPMHGILIEEEDTVQLTSSLR